MMHLLKATACFSLPLRGFVVFRRGYGLSYLTTLCFRRVYGLSYITTLWFRRGYGLSYTTRCEGIIRYGVH